MMLSDFLRKGQKIYQIWGDLPVVMKYDDFEVDEENMDEHSIEVVKYVSDIEVRPNPDDIELTDSSHVLFIRDGE